MSDGIPPVLLRTANRGDAYTLWLWANDAETRRGSFGRDAIEWESHVRWLEEQLVSEFAAIFIAESHLEQPLGSIRFDSSDSWRTARLSYVLAPEMRGRGLSAVLVEQGIAALRKRQARVDVRAAVSPENERSLRVFRRLGWKETQANGAFEFWCYAG